MALMQKNLHRLTWLAIALFLCAQVLLAQHTAEFGPEKHNHHGAPCQIQLFVDHCSAPSLPSMPVLPIVVLFVLAMVLVHRIDFVSRAYRASAPRAPPLSIV
jgi:hypothetical protein